MGGCRCRFRDCSNNSSNSPGIHFFTFPLKNKERCAKWATYSQNLDFLTMPIEKLRNRVVCEKHFRDECFMNYKKERLVPSAIPTLYPLKNGLVLDYEESENPQPKKLEPTKMKHLIPPGGNQDARQVEDVFDIRVEENEVIDNPSYIIEELEMGESEENMEIVDGLSEYILIDGPGEKIRRLNDDTPINSVAPKLLNKDANTIEVTTKPRAAGNTYGNPLKQKLHNKKQRTTSYVDDTAGHENEIAHPRNYTIKTESTYRKLPAIEMIPSIKTSPLELNKTLRTPRKRVQQSEAITIVQGEEEGTVTILDKITEPSEEYSSNNETISLIDPEDSTSSQSQDKCDAEDFKDEVNKYQEIINEQETKIQNLEKLLSEAEAMNAKLKPTAATTQVGTISTSRSNESMQTNTITKQQLFNGIKKYLSPSMVSLVRMEMFGGPDREWKPDEKAVSVELLQLGDNIFNYIRDEWRFRLPPKKDVEKWRVERTNLTEEDDF